MELRGNFKQIYVWSKELSVWAGILADYIVGQFYLDMLESPICSHIINIVNHEESNKNKPVNLTGPGTLSLYLC